MTRLAFLLPLAALTLTSCDTPYFAVFPEKAAKNRAATPGNPHGGKPADYRDEALLSSIPPAPISTDRGGVDIPSDTDTPVPAATYAPNKKITLEELTETTPSPPGSPSAPRPTAPATTSQERSEEPQPTYWFGRPNEGNTSAIPVGPTKKP